MAKLLGNSSNKLCFVNRYEQELKGTKTKDPQAGTYSSVLTRAMDGSEVEWGDPQLK